MIFGSDVASTCRVAQLRQWKSPVITVPISLLDDRIQNGTDTAYTTTSTGYYGKCQRKSWMMSVNENEWKTQRRNGTIHHVSTSVFPQRKNWTPQWPCLYVILDRHQSVPQVPHIRDNYIRPCYLCRLYYQVNLCFLPTPSTNNPVRTSDTFCVKPSKYSNLTCGSENMTNTCYSWS